MKNIRILISVLAMTALVIACTQLETTPVFPKSEVSFSATSSVTSVSVAAKDSLTEAATISWVDPGFAVGLAQSKFKIVVGAAGKNFVTFQSKEFTNATKGTLLAKELNAMALRLGGTIGTPVSLDLKVVASQANNNEPKSSNTLQLAVTPYGDLTLTPSATSVKTEAATSSNVAVTLKWNVAFSGYTGVKAYQFQYAKAGTNFASAVSTDIAALTKSYTQFELNKIALSLGIAAGATGNVDFRVKATNESGTVLYSNTATVAVTTYIAFNSIGIIGDATPGGWDNDVDLYRPDATKPTEWTGALYLIGGKGAKFRAGDAWTDNWGAADFPSGTGVSGGANINVTTSGYYKVNFNVATGAYSFTPITTTAFTSVGLIGAQSNWSTEIGNLTKDVNNDQVWKGTITLAVGELKFRANQNWDFNWGVGTGGSATALSGLGVNGGPNISITTAGTYFVYINTATGDYFFGKSDRSTAFNDIGVIGNATAGGWDSDTNLIRNPANPYKWSGTMTLTAGEAKFRADNDWGVNWGAADFPSGVSTQGGANVPVTPGTYFITFNTATGEYSFTK